MPELQKIQFRCPKCDNPICVAQKHTGKRGKCSRCGVPVKVPSAQLSPFTPESVGEPQSQLADSAPITESPAISIVTTPHRHILTSIRPKSGRYRTKRHLVSFVVAVGIILLLIPLSTAVRRAPSLRRQVGAASQEKRKTELRDTESAAVLDAATLDLPDETNTGAPDATMADLSDATAIVLPNLKPVGYFVAKSLQGGLGTDGGGISVKDKKDCFLVIVAEVPSEWLLPSEPEFLAMQADDASRTSRRHARVYDPSRFMLIVSDGRGFKGNLIDKWDPTNSSMASGFTSGMNVMESTTSNESDNAGPAEDKPVLELPLTSEAIAIAWVIEQGVAIPPYKLQFDGESSVPVPEEQLQPPPIRTRPF